MVEIVKKMMIPGNNFCTMPSGGYETSTLRAPYRFIVLMLNKIFGRANGKSFKMGWILVTYFVATHWVKFLTGQV